MRKTFREEIALRAPADYWETKRKGHELMGRVTGGLSFTSLRVPLLGLVSSCMICWAIHRKVPRQSLGEATLVLIGLFTVWGVRLLVRIWLSHPHLATDAAERVVMVRTHLSLLEGDRLSGDENRQLILQALFRPASDGIVEDEGLPPSMFEFLTRQSK